MGIDTEPHPLIAGGMDAENSTRRFASLASSAAFRVLLHGANQSGGLRFLAFLREELCEQHLPAFLCVIDRQPKPHCGHSLVKFNWLENE
jgi:hypothetical protein